MKTNKDYQDDLKQALNELDKPKKTKEQKENEFLNVILGLLIVAIIAVGIGGAIMIGKTYIDFDKNDPIVNDELVQNDKNDIQDSKDDEIVDDTMNDIIDNEIQDDGIIDDSKEDETINNLIDITNEENGDFEILEFKISREEDKVRFDIKSKTSIAGNIFLMDDKNLNIGPISINVGTNNLYFLINGQNNYSLHFDASNGRSYIYEISNDEIKQALGE